MKAVELTHNDVLRFFPERKRDTHKGNYGKILLLCGSRGYTGAPALAAMGALRTGAGLVYLGVPDSIYDIEAVKLLEPVVIPLPDNNGKLSVNSTGKIVELLSRMDAVLVGPGLGISDETRQVVLTVLREFKGPLVLDADGINVLSSHIDILRSRTFPTILTPHYGEFLKIGGNEKLERLDAAIELAVTSNSIVVLKGHRTIITDGCTSYINPTGNPGMAVGGAGDILSGIIVSLLGQGLSALDAAACGVWLHGKAGDICASEIGEYGMLPADMLEVLPRLLK